MMFALCKFGWSELAVREGAKCPAGLVRGNISCTFREGDQNMPHRISKGKSCTG